MQTANIIFAYQIAVFSNTVKSVWFCFENSKLWLKIHLSHIQLRIICFVVSGMEVLIHLYAAYFNNLKNYILLTLTLLLNDFICFDYTGLNKNTASGREKILRIAKWLQKIFMNNIFE